MTALSSPVVAGRRLSAAAVAGLTGVVVLTVVPLSSGAYPPCPFHALTGWWCPGCGTTRAAVALVHGHLEVAVGDNPAAFLTLPWLLWRLALWVSPALRARVEPRRPVPRAALLGLVALVLVYGVVRNLPGFEVLAPR